MPTQKDPSGRRFVTVETEVPGTPEEVWQAIATGPGVSAWFVPAQIEGREKGAIVMDFGPGMESKSEIQEWKPLERFTALNREGMGPGSPQMATEWSIEARAGGTCRVRVVHSWFADTDDWDKQFESVEKGWPAFFRILQRYMAQFRGQSCARIPLMAFSAVPKDKAWADLSQGLGLAGAKVGQAVKSSSDAPSFAGSLEYDAQKANPELTLAIREPAAGTAHVSLMGMGDKSYVYVCLYFYGASAAAVVEREAPAWQAWIARLFPAGA